MRIALCVAVARLVPVAAGLAGILLGPGMIDPIGGASVPLDSHYRYLSGLLLGMGLGFWLTIPHIEREGKVVSNCWQRSVILRDGQTLVLDFRWHS